MRVDLLLKYLCLAKSRSAAKAACDEDGVSINGSPARAASIVRVGDAVSLRTDTRELTIEILELPTRQASKAEAPRCYRVV
jgi:ribosome-associated heat shock protein Hsp15